MLALHGADKHKQELLVHEQLLEAVQMPHHFLLLQLQSRHLQGEEHRVVVPGFGEEEAHGEGAEVAIGEVLVR